ncbi:glycerophosphodiester phosphodiesterase [Alkalihalobacillus oceani]|uniref:Glycerophosphodiester phosphodiesterase n=1 Tax=Halalkalibacter oceani TaxID=1653776 RepID=A0A9X2DUR2_9BACI|nr:glycerophosphodiester phosphodiesterase family protein [Halalkalibacter oceani]MCM3715828.1 glycerophosphodiester phosphodiesterase [Halalkalibacter oceani]
MKIIAHRGWSGQAPENTLAAFRLALDEPFITEVELDVHLSKDGIPVVIHDHTLERTTNGRGAVRDYTFSELQQLTAGSWFSQEFMAEKIPSLEQVFQMFKGRTSRLVIELKQTADHYPGLEEAVVKLIQSYQLERQVTVISFDHISVKTVKDADAAIETGLVYLGRPTLLVEQARYTGASFISMHYAYITESLINELIQAGIKIGVWTVDDEDTQNKLASFHDELRVTTNYPERIIALQAAH